MTPLFKTQYSLGGRSILTIDEPASDDIRINKIPYYRSVLSLASELPIITLVEDSMVGFKVSTDAIRKQSKTCAFGLRCNVRFDGCDQESKAVFFSKKHLGINLLREMEFEKSKNGFVSFSKYAFDKKLSVAIPFYDSFLDKNAFFSYELSPKLPENTTFFVENNFLPFDGLLQQYVKDFAANYSVILVKSIYYPSRSDFKAWQLYKILCNRTFAVKKQTLDNPNMDHCGSREFCWESYNDYVKNSNS